MKRTWFFLAFLITAGASFADDGDNRSVFFEGTAPRPENVGFFVDNFKMEAGALGYTVAEGKSEAGFIFRFEVEPNEYVYDDGTREPAPSWENQFFITIYFIRNEDDTELVSFSFPFSELDEMYDYFQYLFLKAAVFIPAAGGDGIRASEGDTIVRETIVRETITRETIYPDQTGWQNKLVYLRASAGFPITFYQLQEDGLFKGKAAWAGYDIENPNRDSILPLDNKVIFLPGITLGAEVQFYDFISAELNLNTAWEHLNDQDFISLAAGLEIKFPLKLIRNVVLAPYAAVSLPFANLPIPFSDELDVFDEHNLFDLTAVGIGIQAGIRGGESGSFFIDISFKYTLGDVVVKNHLGERYPNPSVLHYRRSVLGLGIGYKFGLLDR